MKSDKKQEITPTMKRLFMLKNESWVVKKKDLSRVITQFVVSEEPHPDGYKIVAMDNSGAVINFVCRSKQECEENIATFNGITVK